jgi:nitrobindin-like protein
MKRCLAVLLLMCAAVGVYGQQPADSDPLAPLQFLVGEWQGQGTGKPGDSTGGGFTFDYDVQKHVLVRKNFADYAAKNERGAQRHEDLMIIYAEAGALKAMYWDNEDHVIRYVVTNPAAGLVIFTSEPGPGPRFRLSNKLEADNTLSIVFDIKGPGDKGFKRYIEAKATRK